MARIVSYATAFMLIVALLLAGPPGVFQGAAASDESVTVTRGDLPTQQCGDSITVTLSITWSPETPDSGAVTIEETYPSGWTVTQRSAGGSLETDGKVKWFSTDPGLSQVNYTLAIPGDASGTFSFAGIYRDHNMAAGSPDRVTDGPSSLEVTCNDPNPDPDPDPDPEPEPGEGATSVDRRTMSTQQCGSTFTVHLDIDWGPERDSPSLFIEETYPEGWSVSFPSNGGNTETPGKIKWFSTNTDLASVSYGLTPPADVSGSFPFSGEYRDDTMPQSEPNQVVGGAQSVSVTCGSEPEPDTNAVVVRDEIINGQCGEALLVELFVSWNDVEDIFIEETYPAGWSVDSHTGGGNTETPGQVKWFLTDPAVNMVSYTLSVPESEEGTSDFSGIYRDSTMGGSDPDLVVGGDDDVTISCPQDPDPEPEPPAGSVMREIPPVCMGPFTVGLMLSPPDGTSAWIVDELVPEGLEVSDISHGGTFNATQGKIKWVNTDGAAANLTYMLTIPDGTPAGTMYEWNGTFRFDPSMEERANITGQTATTTSCDGVHAYDTDQNCVFDDTELFGLIDAWKAEEATDDELFSGIAHWKLSPGTYCEE